MSETRYENLDGIRAYACVGIILMHVLVNSKLGLSGFIFERVIPSFTEFTYLYMLLSAFSMCCGYFEKFRNNEQSIEQFYKKRYARIWPFFALLCTVELIIEHDLNSLYEWFADLTLVFGLMPNHGITVIGVGWFLGIIFVFYMLFPFFVFLIRDKKNAWIVFAISIILHMLCNVRFLDSAGRGNIVYSSMFFLAGGLIFLYREDIKNNRVISVAVLLGSVLAYYIFVQSTYLLLAVFSMVAVCGISFNGKISEVVFQNRMIKTFSSVSMEIYLSHMLVYRVLEKMRLINMLSNQVLSYVMISMVTIMGAFIVSLGYKKALRLIQEKLKLCL